MRKRGHSAHCQHRILGHLRNTPSPLSLLEFRKSRTSSTLTGERTVRVDRCMALLEPEPAKIERKPHENGFVITVLVDSGASGHYFDDIIIPDLKHRLQGCTSLSTLGKILMAGALLDSTAQGVLQGFIMDDYGEQHLARVAILNVPGIGHNLFSVKTAARKGIVSNSMSTNPGWRRETLPCHFAERTTISTPSS